MPVCVDLCYSSNMTLSRSEQSRRDAMRAVSEAVRNGDRYAVQCAFNGKIMGEGTTHRTLAAAEAARDAVFKRNNANASGEIHARPNEFMKLEVFIAELRNGESWKIPGTSLNGDYDSADKSGQ